MLDCSTGRELGNRLRPLAVKRAERGSVGLRQGVRLCPRHTHEAADRLPQTFGDVFVGHSATIQQGCIV